MNCHLVFLCTATAVVDADEPLLPKIPERDGPPAGETCVVTHAHAPCLVVPDHNLRLRCRMVRHFQHFSCDRLNPVILCVNCCSCCSWLSEPHARQTAEGWVRVIPTWQLHVWSSMSYPWYFAVSNDTTIPFWCISKFSWFQDATLISCTLVIVAVASPCRRGKTCVRELVSLAAHFTEGLSLSARNAAGGGRLTRSKVRTRRWQVSPRAIDGETCLGTHCWFIYYKYYWYPLLPDYQRRRGSM